MIYINKLKAILYPDTLGSSYLGVKPLELDVNIRKFNDGSLMVTIDNLGEIKHHAYLVVEIFNKSMDDLMIAAQIRDIVSRHLKNVQSRLILLGTNYTRYDRVMFEDKRDGFGAGVYASFISSMGYNTVSFLDCHSDKMIDLSKFNPVFIDITQQSCLDQMELLNDSMALLAPDMGSLKKLVNPSVIFEKNRNPETGELSGFDLTRCALTSDHKEVIIVDDICEGGGTFVGIAESIRSNEYIPVNMPLSLYVTHGIFSGKALEKLAVSFNKVYTYITTEANILKAKEVGLNLEAYIVVRDKEFSVCQ